LGVAVFSNYARFSCAYVAAKHPNVVTKAMHICVIFIMSFPMVGSFASTYLLLKRTGVYNNLFMYFLYSAGFTGKDFLIFYAASRGIDDAYIEAAKLDGAGYYRIQFGIVMPMLKTIILGMLLIDIISLWNSWSTPMFYLPKYPTVSYALYLFQFNTDNSVSQVPAQTAGCVMVMVPTLILFIAFRNKFIGNITLGGLKG
jgi:multiple sugar transport system permease protein